MELKKIIFRDRFKRKLLLNNHDFWHFPINPHITRVYGIMPKVMISIQQNFAFEMIPDFFSRFCYIDILRFSTSAIIYQLKPCKLPMSFRCIKAVAVSYLAPTSRVLASSHQPHPIQPPPAASYLAPAIRVLASSHQRHPSQPPPAASYLAPTRRVLVSPHQLHPSQPPPAASYLAPTGRVLVSPH